MRKPEPGSGTALARLRKAASRDLNESLQTSDYRYGAEETGFFPTPIIAKGRLLHNSAAVEKLVILWIYLSTTHIVCDMIH